MPAESPRLGGAEAPPFGKGGFGQATDTVRNWLRPLAAGHCPQGFAYSLFSAFTSLKEVSRGKGFPDIYLLTAERLNLLPSQCIVFEDIYDGILGANAGGFYTCAVYDQYSEHHAAEIQKACGRYIQSFQALL